MRSRKVGEVFAHFRGLHPLRLAHRGFICLLVYLRSITFDGNANVAARIFVVLETRFLSTSYNAQTHPGFHTPCFSPKMTGRRRPQMPTPESNGHHRSTAHPYMLDRDVAPSARAYVTHYNRLLHTMLAYRILPSRMDCSNTAHSNAHEDGK